MNIKNLQKGDTIGIISPSHIANKERYTHIVATIKDLGYQVKLGENIYKNTYGYLASEQERAADLNQMAQDPEVKLVLFGGGEGSNELLPYINYEAIKQNPKYYSSFSDGTTILNAIHAQTGLTTHYGQGPNIICDQQPYNHKQFLINFVEKYVGHFTPNSKWKILKDGKCKGTLTGGYTRNYALLLGSQYFSYNKNHKYILFLEDHESFSSIAEVSTYISHIEQNQFINNVAGLIFGHYAENVPTDLLNRLKRFGEKNNVPVIYTDDFGHGANHAIFPIGAQAELTATHTKESLVFK